MCLGQVVLQQVWFCLGAGFPGALVQVGDRKCFKWVFEGSGWNFERKWGQSSVAKVSDALFGKAIRSLAASRGRRCLGFNDSTSKLIVVKILWILLCILMCQHPSARF